MFSCKDEEIRSNFIDIFGLNAVEKNPKKNNQIVELLYIILKMNDKKK